MMESLIRPLREDEQPPMDLLLLADPSIEMVAGYLPESSCLVAELAGEMIGVCVIQQLDCKRAELKNVAVAEAYLGHGLGKQLVQRAIAMAKEQGFQQLDLGTGNSSISQLALYQKCGFRITGVDVDFFTRHYSQPIWENGIQCRDMIRLSITLI